jgi:hypothetical protein
VYFTQPSLGIICKLQNNEVETLVGIPGETSTSLDGNFTVATFMRPMGLEMAFGVLYVADKDAHVVKQINLDTQQVTTIAGSVGKSGWTDGAKSLLTDPVYLSVSPGFPMQIAIASSSHGVLRQYSEGESGGLTVTLSGPIPGKRQSEEIQYKSGGLSSDGGSFQGGIFPIFYSTNYLFLDQGSCAFKGYVNLVTVNANPYLPFNCYGSTGCQSSGSICTGYNKCSCSQNQVGNHTATCFGREPRVISSGVLTGAIPNPDPEYGTISDDETPITEARLTFPTHISTCFNSKTISEANVIAVVNGAEISPLNLPGYGIMTLPTTTSPDASGISCSMASDSKSIIAVFDSESFNILAGQENQRGDVDGDSSVSLLNGPHTVININSDIVVFTDTGNHKVKLYFNYVGNSALDYHVYTIAGNTSGFEDGYGLSAKFNSPRGMYFDGVYLFIADSGNNAIRRMNLATSYVDTISPANFTMSPYAIERDPHTGDLFVSFQDANRIMRLRDGQFLPFLGGNGTAGYDNTFVANLQLNVPRGMYYDAAEYTLYWADSANHMIRYVRFGCDVGYGAMSTQCSTFSCFAFDPFSDACSGNGECIGPNQCQCHTQLQVSEMCEIKREPKEVKTLVTGFDPTFLATYDDKIYFSDASNVKVMDGTIVDNTTIPGNRGLVYYQSPSENNYLIFGAECRVGQQNIYQGGTITYFTSSETCDDAPDGYIGKFDGVKGIAFDLVSQFIYVCDHGNSKVKKVDYNNGQTTTVLNINDCTPQDIVQDYDTDYFLIAFNCDSEQSGIIVRLNQITGQYTLVIGEKRLVPESHTTSDTIFKYLAGITGIARSESRKQFIFGTSDEVTSYIHIYSIDTNTVVTYGDPNGINGDGVFNQSVRFDDISNFAYMDSPQPNYIFSEYSTGSIRRISYECPSGTIPDENDNCIWSCFGIYTNDSSICSGKGSCIDRDVCECEDGYGGPECNIYECGDILATNSSVCSGKGTCELVPVSDAYKIGCNCSSGYSGDLCELHQCFGVNNTDGSVCSGYGECDEIDHCVCVPGASNYDCSFYECYGYNYTNTGACSGNGDCVGPHTCSCNTSFYGEQCQHWQCFNINFNSSQVCSSKGTCVGLNNCSCIDGVIGENCDTYIHSAIVNITGVLPLYDICDQVAIHSQAYTPSGDIITSRFKSDYSWSIVESSSTLSVQERQDLIDSVLSVSEFNVTIPPELLIPGANYTLNSSVVIWNSDNSNYVVWKIVTFSIKSLQVAPVIVQDSTYVRRTQTISFQGTSSIPECYSSLFPPMYLWTVSDSSAQSTSTTLDIQVADELSTGTHKVIFHVIINSYTFSSDSRNVTLLLDPLQVNILSGDVAIPYNTSYQLTAVLTDTEYPESSKDIQWYTRTSDNFTLLENNRDLSFSIRPEVNDTYEYKIVVKALDGRVAESSVKIQVQPPLVKVPRIIIVTPVNRIMNRNKKITLTASVTPITDLSLISIQWIVTEKMSTLPLVLDKSTILTSNNRTRTIVIRAKILKPGVEYVFRVEASYSQQPIAYSQVSFIASSPPIAGTFSVSPTNGTSLDTLFEFSAPGWTSDNIEALPLRYSYSYIDPVTSELKSLSSFDVLSTFATSIVSSGSTQLTVVCRVRNYFNDETVMTKSIYIQNKVTNVSDITNLLNSITIDDRSFGYRLVAAADMYSKLTVANPAIVQILLNYLTNSTTVDYVNQKLNVLESLTNNIELLDSSNEFLQILTILQSSLNNTSAEDLSMGAGRIIGNILQSNRSTIADHVSDTINTLSQYTLSDLTPGEDAINIDTTNLKIVLMKSYSTDVGSQLLISMSNNSAVSIPDSSNSISDDPDVVYSIEFINYANVETNALYSDKSKDIFSNVVSFRFLDSDGNKVPYTTKDNDHPLRITIETKGNLSDVGFICKYIVSTGDDWKTDGCWLGEVDEMSITCLCNHTTSFAAFIQYSSEDTVRPESPIAIAVYIIQIVFHTIYIVLIIVLIPFLFFNRNKQPIRSRLFAPYFCLFAVLIESVLQGIIRNSLLLQKKRNILALNVVGNIIMIVVNPLAIMSLFVFLWQCIRYFLLRHLYELMGRKRGIRSTVMLICRIVTSNLVFVIVGTVAYIALTIYYAVFAGVGMGKQKSFTKSEANSLTIATSVSYLIMMLAVSCGIIGTFIYDSIGIPIQQQLMVTKKNTTSNNTEDNKKETNGVKVVLSPVRHHFFKEDPLMFRLDSLLITMAVIVGILSFVLGIIEQYLDTRQDSPMMVAFLVFDLLYTFLRIAGFGGSISIIRLKTILKTRNNGFVELGETQEESATDDAHDTILRTLMSERGFERAKEYCIKEYSLENLLIWRELSLLNFDWLILSDDARQQAITEMCERFIDSGSEYEVNIPGAVKKQLQTMNKNVKSISVDKQQQILFKLFHSVMTNISDTFSRFVETDEFNEWLKLEEMERALEDKSLSTDGVNKKRQQLKAKWFNYNTTVLEMDKQQST